MPIGQPRIESLEAMITRIHADAVAVHRDLTARDLAVAIAGAGWTHPRNPATHTPGPIHRDTVSPPIAHPCVINRRKVSP